MEIKKNKKIIFIALSIIAILLIAGFSYASFVYTAPSKTGNITTISDTFCKDNNINKLSDCIKAQNANTTNIQTAESIIEARNYDTTQLSPVVTSMYEKKVKSHLSSLPSGYPQNFSSLTSERAYSNSEPVFDSSTGYYSFKYDGTKTIGEIIEDTNNGHTKYLIPVTTTKDTTTSGFFVLHEVTKSGSLYYPTDVDLFTSVAVTLDTVSGLYAADDYNNTKSYFFRGNPLNNFVKFGGIYYRIIRINGDGSIRLIYVGSTATNTTGVKRANYNNSKSNIYDSFYMYGDAKTKDSSITYNIAGSSNYYYFDNYNSTSGTYDDEPCTLNMQDNTVTCTLKGHYLYGKWKNIYNSLKTGYDGDGQHPYKYVCNPGTFDSATETVTCSDNYFLIDYSDSRNIATNNSVYGNYIGYSVSEQNQKSNVKDSNVKTEVDAWYQTNILNKTSSYGNSYDTYIADSVFCADRTYTDRNFPTYYKGIGMYFRELQVYYKILDQYNGQNNSFMCTDVRDRFTVNETDVNRGVVGNGNLTYKAGLISGNEAVYAGNLWSQYNNLNYLNTGRIYWTMTPLLFTTSSAGGQTNVVIVSAQARLTNYYPDYPYDIRPVINLDKDIYITSGNGTASKPYEVISKQEYESLQSN